MGINVIINPGAGAVADAKLEHAVENMRHFITDCKIKDLEFLRLPDIDEGGRFGF